MAVRVYRRQRIINFMLETIEESKRSGRVLDKNTLIAQTCMGFYCGERLVKEIIKHLELLGKIDFHQEELNPEDKQ